MIHCDGSLTTVRRYHPFTPQTYLYRLADDHYQKYLTPAFALSGILPTSTPLYENMSPTELEAFLAEMEPDIRAADRDLREIEMLESKDVTAAGKLPEYQKLQPRLEQLLQESEENHRKHDELEQRIAKLMNQYATTVRRSYDITSRRTNSSCRRINSPNYLSLGTTRCTMQKARLQSFIATMKRDRSLDWTKSKHFIPQAVRPMYQILSSGPSSIILA